MADDSTELTALGVLAKTEREAEQALASLEAAHRAGTEGWGGVLAQLDTLRTAKVARQAGADAFVYFQPSVGALVLTGQTPTLVVT